MSKRFTDTDKWKKPFLRGLQGAYKLLWFYICDDCDHAGIWQVDTEIAQIKIGEKITEEGAIKMFGEKITVFDNGKKWFIPSFIEFQYPKGLNPTNKAHGSVIQILIKYKLINDQFKPLGSPLYGAKDKDKDMDKDKESWENEKNKFLTDTEWMSKTYTQLQILIPDLKWLMDHFVKELEVKEDYKPQKEIKSHFVAWFRKNKPDIHELKKFKPLHESSAPTETVREKHDRLSRESVTGSTIR